LSGPQIGAYPRPRRHDLEGRSSDVAHKRDTIRTLGEVIAGRVNWVLQLTLATGATSTVVAADTITPGCQVSLDPMTPQAAALMGKVWLPQVDRQPGSPSAPTQTGRLIVQHPMLNSGVVATFRASVKG
jgi:hypothetical protein